MLYSQIQDLIEMPNPFELSEDEGYKPGQIGYGLTQLNDLASADLVLLSCDEWRGRGSKATPRSADAVRKQLYSLYLWHTEIRIADAGNVRNGAQLADTYAALKMVIKELLKAGKRVLVFGGSHDLTMGIYQAFAELKILVEATAVDALIDLDSESHHAEHKFLLDMLTSEPNYVKQFNLIGFQSYFVNPTLLETIDKLRFDCFRVGKVQERIDDVEPAICSSHLLTFDIAAMAHAAATTTVGFMAARAALGFGEAGNFPAAIKAVADWFPKKERALATGIFNAGTNIGAVVAPIMVPLILGWWGWQQAFILTGAIGFILSLNHFKFLLCIRCKS